MGDVQFNDGSCSYYSSDYLCQKAAQTYDCASGSPGGCTVSTVVPAYAGYSTGAVLRVYGGHQVYRSTDQHSCPSGFKIWAPRDKNDFTIVNDAMNNNHAAFPNTPHLIVDVTRPEDGCGGCTGSAMNSG